MKSLNWLLYEVHRWLGIALGLFMFVWFSSGLLIMYAEPINVQRSQALAHAELLIPQTGWLSVGQAWDASSDQRKASAAALRARNPNGNEQRGSRGGDNMANRQNGPAKLVEAKLLSRDGQPIWLVEDSRNQRYALSAIDGSLQETSAEQAVKIAESWLRVEGRDEINVSYQGLLLDGSIYLRTRDGVQQVHKLAVGNDGEQLLILARTGEVIHTSTPWQRFSFLAGNWIHNFKPLDALGFNEIRHDVQLWAGLLAAIASLTGLIIGWLRWRPGFNGKKTYSEGRTQPYREFWLKWHFWTGLIGGTLALFWAFSGFISTNPSKIFTQGDISREELSRYLGDVPDVVKQWQPAPLASNQAANIVELNWRYLGGEAVLTAFTRDGQRLPQAIDNAQSQISEESLKAAVLRVTEAATVKKINVLTDYDNYYYPDHDQTIVEKPLPVVRIDLDDHAETQFYLDPKNGRLLSRYDQSRRYYRWLYSALHHWDFGYLYQRPLWDIWMLIWVGFGIVLGASSVVIGWKRLQKTFSRKKTSKRREKPVNDVLATENIR